MKQQRSHHPPPAVQEREIRLQAARQAWARTTLFMNSTIVAITVRQSVWNRLDAPLLEVQ